MKASHAMLTFTAAAVAGVLFLGNPFHGEAQGSVGRPYALDSRPVDDPDGIGRCPGAEHKPPVRRQGLDTDGWPTWWHTDGTLTKKVWRRVTYPDGSEGDVPEVLYLSATGEPLPDPLLAAEADGR